MVCYRQKRDWAPNFQPGKLGTQCTRRHILGACGREAPKRKLAGYKSTRVKTSPRRSRPKGRLNEDNETGFVSAGSFPRTSGKSFDAVAFPRQRAGSRSCEQCYVLVRRKLRDVSRTRISFEILKKEKSWHKLLQLRTEFGNFPPQILVTHCNRSKKSLTNYEQHFSQNPN